MWVCLLITAIIAGVIGWLLRGSGKEKLIALEQQWMEQYQSVDRARKKYADEVEQLSLVKEENNELANQLSLQKKSFEQNIQHLKEQAYIAVDKQDALLVQKDEELARYSHQLHERIVELEEELASNKQHLEKIMADKEQDATSLSQLKAGNEEKTAALSTKLHINQADLIAAEKELVMLKTALNKEKSQSSELKKNFSVRAKILEEQLDQKERLLSLAIADKEVAQKTLAETLAKVETTEKSFFSEMKDKLDDFNADRKSDDKSHSTTSVAHENKISTDIRSMLEATGINDLAKKGINKVKNRIDDMKK